MVVSLGHMTVYVDKSIKARLKDLAKESNVSVNFIVNRAIIQVLDSGRIPWPTAGSAESTARKKYGEAAVPTFDEVEDQAKVPEDGRKDPIKPGS